MPIRRCFEGGRPGFTIEGTSKHFMYTEGDESSRNYAYKRAVAMLRAIKANQHARRNRKKRDR